MSPRRKAHSVELLPVLLAYGGNGQMKSLATSGWKGEIKLGQPGLPGIRPRAS